MSDSEKPTKKTAAKKAAKKKAAVNTATDIAAGPKGEEVLSNLGEHLDEVIDVAREAGVQVIAGVATVSLHLEVVAASTPTDAVDQVLQELALNGLRGYTFVVRDDLTQDMYSVTEGKSIHLNPVEGDDGEE